MYNLMIVDDDRLVRKRIISAVPFETLELQLCAEAENGMQALELFAQYHPQIVIMDINIPLMNGIDVAKQILAENEDANIIIVTGYGTVDFAREAIRSGMIDFLLKPINFGELEDALRRIIAGIQEETRQALEQQRMERLLERSMPLLRGRYFLSLMMTPPDGLTEEDCRRYLDDFGITGPVTDICTVIVSPNYSGLSVNEQMPMQAVLEEELGRGLMAAGLGCIVLFDSLQRAIVVVYGTKNNLDYTVEQKLSVIRDRMRYVYHFDFHASIGGTVAQFRCLQESYHSAEQALGYWNVFGDNNVVNSGNVRIIDQQAPEAAAMRYGEIMDLLMDLNWNKAQETLTDYLNQLVFDSKNSIQVLQQKSVELLALMLSCAQELGADCRELLSKKPYTSVLFSGNIGEIKRVVLDSAAQLIEEVSGKREQNKSRAIGSAKRYILQHYADPELNLAKVSAQVNLSPSYLSQLFKKAEDCSFTDYLNRVRIDQAKQLLRDTHMRVYEVSDAVGYQNSKYFFQVFKQITGKRPREFYEEAPEETGWSK